MSADPTVVFVAVAVLMGAAIIGLVFPFAWSAGSKGHALPVSRTGPRFDEEGLPWMPGGEVFKATFARKTYSESAQADSPWSTEANMPAARWTRPDQDAER